MLFPLMKKLLLRSAEFLFVFSLTDAAEPTLEIMKQVVTSTDTLIIDQITMVSSKSKKTNPIDPSEAGPFTREKSSSSTKIGTDSRRRNGLDQNRSQFIGLVRNLDK